LKESLEIGKEGQEGCPNQWPMKVDWEDAEPFKETMVGFFDTCKGLHAQVMRAIALGLGIEEGWFDGFVDNGNNNLRLLHYPAVKGEVFRRNKLQVRAGEHTDYGECVATSKPEPVPVYVFGWTRTKCKNLGSITLLFQDSRGGLQVRSPGGTFVNATPIPDTVVVNAGDLLARWSNDLIKSTVHRVMEPPPPQGKQAPADDEEYPARYSVAYFCNPNFDKLIDAIPGTFGGEKGEKKYDAINSGEYLERRLAATI
jgi:isopenicillin N synthase-like dioxygenase